jgi:DNA polymerase-3 subunit alpha (Gram-positive type)
MKPLGVVTLAQLKYVVFDIETTGLHRNYDRIIQIAAIKVDGIGLTRKLKQKLIKLDPNKSIRDDEEVFNAFVNPGRKIPQNIQELTRITDSMVRNQPDEKIILKEFINFIGDRILVAHNGIGFDVKFIEFTAIRNKVKLDNFLCLDTMWLSRKLFPQHKSHKLGSLKDRYKMDKKYSNEFLNQQHNAFVDVVLTTEALKVFMKELKKQNRDKLLLI